MLNNEESKRNKNKSKTNNFIKKLLKKQAEKNKNKLKQKLKLSKSKNNFLQTKCYKHSNIKLKIKQRGGSNKNKQILNRHLLNL